MTRLERNLLLATGGLLVTLGGLWAFGLLRGRDGAQRGPEVAPSIPAAGGNAPRPADADPLDAGGPVGRAMRAARHPARGRRPADLAADARGDRPRGREGRNGPPARVPGRRGHAVGLDRAALGRPLRPARRGHQVGAPERAGARQRRRGAPGVRPGARRDRRPRPPAAPRRPRDGRPRPRERPFRPRLDPVGRRGPPRDRHRVAPRRRPAHDLPYLEAIARRGGPEGARALVEALSKAPDPARFPPETWRDLDLRRSPGASEVLASALADPKRSPGALRAVAELAGRPGASPALVDALAALDTDGQDRLVRTQVLLSLGATGDDRAIARLLDQAAKGGDYGSVAARAVAEVDAATPAARAKLLETARSTADENLRTHLATALGNLKRSAVPMLVEGSRKERRGGGVARGPGRWGRRDPESRRSAAFMAGNGLSLRGRGRAAGIGTPEAKRMPTS
jgi:hypothetical protein